MLKFGVLGGADIAKRIFIPSLIKSENAKCIAVASNNNEKREFFKNEFNVDVTDDYYDILKDPNIDSVYIPLPPTLIYKWAVLALKNNKNVYLEKPLSTKHSQTKKLIKLSEKKSLVIQENYMFQYHSQLKWIKDTIESGEIGEVRLIKTSFGFPFRGKNDFRYCKKLGGGALMDAGGYVTKMASLMLGNTIKVKTASKNDSKDLDVDIFGSVSFENSDGLVCQASYGMDCSYQCSLEIWGSKGRIYTNRIFTAPENLKPTIEFENIEGKKTITLLNDNHCLNSIEKFCEAVKNKELEKEFKDKILLQSGLINDIRKMWRA